MFESEKQNTADKHGTTFGDILVYLKRFREPLVNLKKMLKALEHYQVPTFYSKMKILLTTQHANTCTKSKSETIETVKNAK